MNILTNTQRKLIVFNNTQWELRKKIRKAATIQSALKKGYRLKFQLYTKLHGQETFPYLVDEKLHLAYSPTLKNRVVVFNTSPSEGLVSICSVLQTTLNVKEFTKRMILRCLSPDLFCLIPL